MGAFGLEYRLPKNSLTEAPPEPELAEFVRFFCISIEAPLLAVLARKRDCPGCGSEKGLWVVGAYEGG